MVVLLQPTLFSLLAAFFSLLLFYLLYEWWYGRETFWQINRLYLLLTPAIAFAIPHIQLTVSGDVVRSSAEGDELLALLQQWQANQVFEAPSSGPQLGETIFWIYIAGLAWMLLRLLKSSYGILQLIRNGLRRPGSDCTLIVHDGLPGPASFFSYVFSSSAQSLPEMVLAHELVHVRQRHTIDVLLMECWVALHWYNPLIYRFRARLRATHEFIADAAVVGEKRYGAYDYARLLIAQPLNKNDMLYNTFAAQISSRLRMLARKPSPSWRVIAHGASLPVILLLFLFFSIQVGKSSTVLAVAEHIADWEAQDASIPDPLARLMPLKMGQLLDLSPEDTLPNKEKVLTVVGYRLADDSVKVQSPAEKVMMVVGYPLGSDTLQGQLLKRDTIQFESSRAPKVTMEEPLFVIDGEVQTIPNPQVFEQFKPEDIESINVIKGESAIARYGEKGKNGVIEIYTKKGKAESKGIRPESRTFTYTDKANGSGAPRQIEMNVQISRGDQTGITAAGPEGNVKRTNIRVMSNGELVGEVKNVRKQMEFSSDQIIMEDVEMIREGSKKGSKTTDLRTITLEFSDRQRAVEVLRSLKKNN